MLRVPGHKDARSGVQSHLRLVGTIVTAILEHLVKVTRRVILLQRSSPENGNSPKIKVQEQTRNTMRRCIFEGRQFTITAKKFASSSSKQNRVNISLLGLARSSTN